MFRRKTTIKKPTITLPARDQYVLNTYTRRMKRYEELVYVCCFWVGYDLLLGKLLVYLYMCRKFGLLIYPFFFFSFLFLFFYLNITYEIK